MEKDKTLVSIDPTLLALIHGSINKEGGLMPFAREIMLVECHIAGTSYREITDIEPSLTPGTLLVLKREPKNPHDELAIMILSQEGHQLGYIPQLKNDALARLMDAGKILFARLESKEWQGDWLRAEVRVFLRD